MNARFGPERNQIVPIEQRRTRPAKAQLPLKTENNNCGSSSRLLRRRNPPVGVGYGPGLPNSCVAAWGASVRMLRNFGIRKMRFPRPTQSDLWSLDHWKSV
jgi:hypothetical protein